MVKSKLEVEASSAEEVLKAALAMGKARQQMDGDGGGSKNRNVKISNDDELWNYVKDTYGVEISRHKVCPHHDTPFEAFANAYFARDGVAIWLGSRGFGGKTYLEALLCFIEETVLGADVALLGGSKEQAQRGHEYTTGWWDHENAPRNLLLGDPTAIRTRLSNGGAETVQAASSKSVRGAHPQRLRIDEADECEIEIIDAALGQPMSKHGVTSHVLMASTHHNPDGTVTELKRRIAEDENTSHWRIYSWCYKENLQVFDDEGNVVAGWLEQSEIDKAIERVSPAMFKIEYDLQEPSVNGRAISGDAVDAMFNRKYGTFAGRANEVIERPCCSMWKITRTPCKNHKYATGVDWGKKRDWTVIITFRMDSDRWWMVSFERSKELPWDVLVEKVKDRMERYPGKLTHDSTGIGEMAHDFLGQDIHPNGIDLNGKRRTTLFTQYVLAVERGDMEAPRITSMYIDHYYATNEMLYQGGHPPDSFIAGAMAWACRDLMYDLSLAPVGVSGQSAFSGIRS